MVCLTRCCSLFEWAQMLKPKKTEVTDKLRQEINKVVNRYIDQGESPNVRFDQGARESNRLQGWLKGAHSLQRLPRYRTK
eukprot:scaffold316366_cov18-Tisochrysis_lutea.AAC.1